MVGNTDAIQRNNGKFSNCLSFDGKTNGYIEIPDSNSLRLSGKTVSFWLKVDEKKTYNMIYGYDNAFDSYTGFFEDGNMKLYWTDETGNRSGRLLIQLRLKAIGHFTWLFMMRTKKPYVYIKTGKL